MVLIEGPCFFLQDILIPERRVINPAIRKDKDTLGPAFKEIKLKRV